MEYGESDLHIVQGGSAGGQLVKDVGIAPEGIFEGVDDLSCGPLPSVAPLEGWRKLRRDYWLAPERAPVCTDGLPDPGELYVRLVQERVRLEAAERIFLWLGTTLSEQLRLAWLVAVFEHLGLETEKLHLLDLQPCRGEPVLYIGELNAELLKKLSRWRQPRDAELACYQAVWQAITSHSPDGLIALCDARTSAFKSTRDALKALMARYPEVKTGLNVWDRKLLETCRDVRLKAARIVGETFLASRDHRNPDWPGDLHLFDRLKRLGDERYRHPLVTLVGDPSAMRFLEVSITGTGKAVLAGEANFVALNGIDEWIGGVHLSSEAGRLWYFDGETLVPGGAFGSPPSPRL